MKSKHRIVSVLMSAFLAFGALSLPASVSALSEENTVTDSYVDADFDYDIIVSGDFEYYVDTFYHDDGESEDPEEYEGATIANYIGKSTTVTIPSEIDGYTVYAVDDFKNASITTINIPATVEMVYGYYEECPKLEAINVDDSSAYYKSVDGVLYCYYDDNISLDTYPVGKKNTTYNIPDFITEISGSALKNSYIEKIVINSNVESIGPGVFSGCPKLTDIEVSADNKTYFSKDGVLFENMTSTDETDYEEEWDMGFKKMWFEKDNMILLCCYPAGKTQTSYAVPKNVEIISAQAFANAVNLKKLVFSSNLLAIDDDAFENCKDIAEIQGGNSVCYIGGGVFDDTVWCKNQSNGVMYFGKVLYGYKGIMPLNYTLDIKEGTETICSQALYGKIGLTKVNIPNSVKFIGAGAFAATSITELTIPESVDYLFAVAADCARLKTLNYNAVDASGYYGFAGLGSLTTVNIGKDVKSISSVMFYASGVKTINGGENIERIGVYAFEDTPWLNLQKDCVYLGKVLVSYCGTMPKDTSIEVKEGTVSIADEAFIEQSNLVNVVLPSSLEHIGSQAFAGTGLKSINLPDGVKKIYSEAFSGLPDIKSVVIPQSVEYIGDNAFGYYVYEDEETLEFCYVEDFTVHGYSGSAAQKFAEKYDFKFVSIGGAIKGDVNGDGDVTVDDATAIQKHLADIEHLDDSQISIADVNGDNDVNIDDVTMIQKYVADIISSL